MYFSEGLLYSQVWLRQRRYIVKYVQVTKEESKKIVNFMTPRDKGSYKSYSENTLFLKKSFILPGMDQTN